MDILHFINTLIFALIASTCAIVLLFLMFVDSFADYFPFMVTVEVGLVITIIWCLATIVNYDNKSSEDLAAAKAAKHRFGCPDFWTLTGNPAGGGTLCSNTTVFDKPPGAAVTYRYVFGANDSMTRVNEDIRRSAATNQHACSQRHDVKNKFVWTGLDSLCDTLP